MPALHRTRLAGFSLLVLVQLLSLSGCTNETVKNPDTPDTGTAANGAVSSNSAVDGQAADAASPGSSGADPVTFAYKFRQGDSFRDHLRVEVKSSAGPNEVILTTEVTSEWKVLEADPVAGGKLLRQVLGVKAEIVTQMGVFVYDSASGTEPSNPLWVNAYGPEIKSQLRHNFECQIAPHGEVSAVRFVGDGVPPSSEELESRAKLVFDPLPDNPVRVGESFERRETHNIVGQQISETAIIVLKEVQTDGDSRIAVFDVSADMKAETPPPGATVVIGYVGSPFQEQFHFDLNQGRISYKSASNKRFIEQSVNGVKIRQTQAISSEYRVQ